MMNAYNSVSEISRRQRLCKAELGSWWEREHGKVHVYDIILMSHACMTACTCTSHACMTACTYTCTSLYTV